MVMTDVQPEAVLPPDEDAFNYIFSVKVIVRRQCDGQRTKAILWSVLGYILRKRSIITILTL